MGISKLIEGRNVHVYKYEGIDPFEIVCAKDCLLEIEQELIGATTPESGSFKEIRPRLKSWRLAVSGATTSDNDGNISIFYFIEKIAEAHDMMIAFTDNEGNIRTIRGDCFVEIIPISGPADGFSEFDLELRGSAGFSMSSLTPPEVGGQNVTSGTFTVSGGYIQFNIPYPLSLSNIIGAWQEGTNMESASISYAYNASLGRLTPDPLSSIDGQKIFVIWTY
jgi:hypothetical protein